TDWAMPEMNGLELVQAITDNDLGVPVGMVASQGTPEMKQQAREAGALFMLNKPFTADGLRDALDGVV
ncbi:MAG: response regulator, partial [Pseudomonadota bacterium]